MSLDKNYQGTDVNLETSLEEYGFVARPITVDYADEYFVIYKMDDNQYGSGHIRESELNAIVNGTEWASEEDVNSMLETVGASKQEWMDLPFTSKFSDLVSYWGTENIMGTDYYPNDKNWAFEEIGLESDSDDNDDLVEYVIPTNYATALINGDYSGLSDEEEQELNEFTETVIERTGNANFMLGNNDEGEYFSLANDINNLGSTVMKVYIRPSNEYKRGGFIYEVQKKGSPSNDMRETMFTAKNLTELKKKIIEKHGTSEGFLVSRRTEQGYYVSVKFEDGGMFEEPIGMMKPVSGKIVGRVPVLEDLLSSEVKDFIDYVYEAYKEDGFTKEQVKKAVNKYLKELGKEYTYGGGDSLDRERVYEFLLNPNLKEIKNPAFADGGGVGNVSYDKIYEVLKENIDESIDDLGRTYENSSDFTGEEIEHKFRDGFIPYTNGGYELSWYEYLSMMNGSGYTLPTEKLQAEMQRHVDYSYELAKDTFKETYPEIVDVVGEENIDYNSLYEAGFSDEAEQLSEWEMENMSDEDTIRCSVIAYYYEPTNDRGQDGKHTISLQGDINLEAPYHRKGKNDDFTEVIFTFDSMEELKSKLEDGLKNVIDWFNGSKPTGSDDDTFAKGGKAKPKKPKMVRTQFEEEEFDYAKGGGISSKELDLNHQYTYEIDGDNNGSIYKEAGVYFVQGFENGKHFSETFEKFKEAKDFYISKSVKKHSTGGSVYSDMTEKEFLAKYFGANVYTENPSEYFDIKKLSSSNDSKVETFISELKRDGYSIKKKSFSDFTSVMGVKKKDSFANGGGIEFKKGKGRGVVKEVYFKDGFRPSFYVSYDDDENDIKKGLKSWCKIHNYNYDDIVKVKYADGGGVGINKERFNLHFNYNPSNLSNEDAEKIVEQYTKDWKHDNDWDNVSFYVFNLTKEKADELKAELKMEDTFNIEIEESRNSFAKGGGVDDNFKRFDVDFYDSSDVNRDTSVELIIRQDSLKNAIKDAIKKAYELKKNYIEFYHRGFFLGSIDFAKSNDFIEGKFYKKFMSNDLYSDGGGVDGEFVYAGVKHKLEDKSVSFSKLKQRGAKELQFSHPLGNVLILDNKGYVPNGYNIYSFDKKYLPKLKKASYTGNYADGGGVDFDKVKKGDEIYREHNREIKEKGIKQFSKESATLWDKKYDDKLNKLKLTFEEKNQLNPKNWYANGGGVDDFKMSYDEMTTYEKSNHIHYNPMNSRWEVKKNGENKEFWNQEQAEKYAGFEFDNDKDSRYSRKKYEALFGYAKGGGVDDEVMEVSKAIFDSNNKRGKISTSFGSKSLDGLKSMIENTNYTSEEIANSIFYNNDKKGKISTSWGDKTYEGLLNMINNSRGNKYANGGGVDDADWIEESLIDLQNETGFDDLVVENSDNNHYTASNGDAEFEVFETEDDARERAIELVKEDLEENLQYFSKDWLMNYIDGEDFFTGVYNEWNESYANDIESEDSDEYSNRLIEEMVDNGIVSSEEAKEDDFDAEDYKEDFVKLMTSNQIEEGNDGLDYYVSNFGEEQAFKVVSDNNLINIDEASESAIDTDGIGHFLSRYDGEQIDLSNGHVAYRVN